MTSKPRSRWRRVARWAGLLAGGLAVALAAVVVGIVLLLHSERFHQYLIREAEARASTAVGSAVTIGDLRVGWSLTEPTVDVDRIVVAGAAPYASPPLARIGHVHVGIAVTSLLRAQGHLSALEVDRPQVAIVEDASGRTNVPRGGGGGTGGGVDAFDLAVRHAVIRDGEVSYNGRAQGLSADVRELQVTVGYTPAGRRYTGQIGFQDGRLEVRGFRPITHALTVAFAATPAKLEITQLRWSGDHSQLDATAAVTDYAAPRVTAQYQLRLDLGLPAELLHADQMPAGVVEVDGSAGYTAGGKASGLAAVTAQGTFRSDRLRVKANGLAFPVSGLAGRYALANGALRVEGIRARVLGGGLTASLNIEDLAGAARARVEAQLQGAQLAAVQAAGPAETWLEFGKVGVSGSFDSVTQGSWRGDFKQLQFSTQAQVTAALAGGTVTLPLRSTAQVSYRNDTLTFQKTTLQTPATQVTVDGTLGVSGATPTAGLTVGVESRDVGEFERAGNTVLRALGQAALPKLGLGGRMSFQGTVRGGLNAPAIAGTVAATDLRVRQTAWRRVGVRFEASPQRVAVSQATLARAGGGSVDFNGETSLTNWGWGESNPMRVRVAMSGMPLTVLAELAGRSLPVEGRLAGTVSLSGSAERPVGQGGLTLVGVTVAAGGVQEPVERVTIGLKGDGRAVTAAVTAALPAGTVEANGSFDVAQTSYKVSLHAAKLELGRLKLVTARKVPVAGVVTIDGNGSGNLAHPAFTVTVTTPRVTVEGQAITDLSLRAALTNNTVTARLASTAVATRIQGTATIGLGAGYPATVAVNTGTIPLATVLAAFAPQAAASVKGEAEIHATATGPLAEPQRMQARVRVPVLSINYGTAVKVAATAPLEVDLDRDVVTLHPAELRGDGTNMTVSARVPLRGEAGMKASAVGTVDLGLLGAIDPDLSAGGQARFDVEAAGRWPKAAYTGTVELANVSVGARGLPVSLQQGSGELALSGDRLSINRFRGTVGGGPIQLTGAVLLNQGPRFDLAIEMNQVRMLVPTTVRETLGGTLAFTGTPAAASLTGRVRVENISTTSQFDFSTLLGQIAEMGNTISAPGSFQQNLALNVAVTTPNQIQTTTRDFSLQANASVTVRGTAAEPVILGRVNVASGDLIFRGNRYQVSGGTLDFVNPNQTQAVVNISADTTIQQYDLHLHFQGPADNLQTNYTSDPALPPADIINLLAFGQTTEATAANATPGNLGAENLIASAVSSQLTDRVQKIAGISQLSVNPVLGGGQQTAGARITIQQRVTGNLFVTISTDVTSAQRDAIQIQYKLSPRVSLSGTRDQNGSYGLNASFKHSW